MKKIFTQGYARFKEDSLGVFCLRTLRFFVFKIAAWLYKVKKRKVKIQFGNIRYIEREILGNKMLLDLSDAGISYELLINKKREPFIGELIKREIRPGDVVIDVGANIGYYALLEARLVGKDGTIYCLEPVPSNFKLLIKNIKLNNYKNIRAYQLAAGSKKEKKYIYVTEKRNWSSIIKPQGKIQKKILIDVISLDEFIKDKPFPRFIRMDVEGYELEILKGMKRILSSQKPLKIFMEIHPSVLGNQTKALLELLKRSGFRIKIITSEPYPEILAAPQFFQKIYNSLSKKIDFPIGILNIDIEDLLQDQKFVQGGKKWVEVLFERG